MKPGDIVNRKNPSYQFPGTVLAVYLNLDGVEYAVVQMDTFKLQHIFKTSDLVLDNKG